MTGLICLVGYGVVIGAVLFTGGPLWAALGLGAVGGWSLVAATRKETK